MKGRPAAAVTSVNITLVATGVVAVLLEEEEEGTRETTGTDEMTGIGIEIMMVEEVHPEVVDVEGVVEATTVTAETAMIIGVIMEGLPLLEGMDIVVLLGLHLHLRTASPLDLLHRPRHR